MSSNSSMVSVIIPCYNGAMWLESAIQSITQQSYRNIEILIYDDGSTDESWTIINSLAKSDGRIVAMGSRINFGIVHALNALLDAAGGAYIARMDCDDVSLLTRIERQLEFMKAKDIDLCGSWFSEFGDGIRRKVRWPTEIDEVRAAMLFQNSICHPTILARREVFSEFRYRPECNLAEDYDLFVRASTRFRLANMPEVQLHYRRHKDQATRARRTQMEVVTRKIRIYALNTLGIYPSDSEQRIHHLIRAPSSIKSLVDFEDVGHWLIKVANFFDSSAAKNVVASQWTRAAVRAAPLGFEMLHAYRHSPLRMIGHRSLRSDIDLTLLAFARLDYGSRTFEAIRRFGLGS